MVHRIALAAWCLLFFSPLALTAAVPADNILIQDIEGRVRGASLQIFLDAGPVVTKAMRIYSEPSHTLLVYFIDSAFKQTGPGKEWIASVIGSSGAACVTTTLPGSGSVQVPARPLEDDRIAVWANGTWPTLGEKDQLVADGKIGNRDFHFTTSIPRTAASGISPDTLYHNCCTGLCGTGCIDCTSHRFTCCIGAACCAAYHAGFDNDNIVCGFVNCDPCSFAPAP